MAIQKSKTKVTGYSECIIPQYKHLSVSLLLKINLNFIKSIYSDIEPKQPITHRNECKPLVIDADFWGGGYDVSM